MSHLGGSLLIELWYMMNIYKITSPIDYEISSAIELSKTNNHQLITKRILGEKFPLIDWDKIDFNNLQKDDFCIDNILGFISFKNIKNNTQKMYFVKCEICTNDPSLYGLGITLMSKGNIKQNKKQCGCTNHFTKTKYQYIIKIHRHAKSKGYVFCGFYGDFLNNKTKLKLSCPYHGKWNTTSILHFLDNNRGCYHCSKEKNKYDSRKDMNYFIDCFMKTNSFLPGTIFCRKEDKSQYNTHIYWSYKCPICSNDEYVKKGLCTGIFNSTVDLLKRGLLSCRCSNINKILSYINLVLDNDIPIALKYGITSNTEVREKTQNRNSIYDIVNCGVWEFESSLLCKSAEAECKRTFSPVLEAREMKDGYTETTSPLDIDKIIEIYENWGGVRIK